MKVRGAVQVRAQRRSRCSGSNRMTSFRDTCARFWGLALLATGCATEPEAPAPEISSVTAVAGVANALSALVTVEVQAADSVRVRFRPLTEPSRLDSTP